MHKFLRFVLVVVAAFSASVAIAQSDGDLLPLPQAPGSPEGEELFRVIWSDATSVTYVDDADPAQIITAYNSTWAQFGPGNNTRGKAEFAISNITT